MEETKVFHNNNISNAIYYSNYAI